MENSNSTRKIQEKSEIIPSIFHPINNDCFHKKRNYSDMMNISIRVKEKQENCVKNDDSRLNIITKCLENLAIKKQFKISKCKSIVRFFTTKENHNGKENLQKEPKSEVFSNEKNFSYPKSEFSKFRCKDNKIQQTSNDFDYYSYDKSLCNENIEFDCIKKEQKYNRDSNKFYYIDKNSGLITVLDKSSSNDGLDISNIDTNIESYQNDNTKLEKSIDEEKIDLMMEIEELNLNRDDNMAIDITPELFLEQEKDLVEKHYKEKNKKILNLFLNGNRM